MSVKRILPPMRRALRAMAMLLAAIGALMSAPVAAQTYSSMTRGYAWVDPSSHLTATWSAVSACAGGGAVTDDVISGLLNIGFTFRFGSTNYTQLRIMTNGRLQFSNNFCGYGTESISPRTYPYPMPNSNLNRTMRVYGGDLDVSPTGTGTSCPSGSCFVRYAALGTAPNRTFVVSWVNVPEWNAPGSTFTFQVILYESGEFVYQYGASSNTSGGSGEIGWQLSTSDFRVTQRGFPASGTAIRYFIALPQSICIPAGQVLSAASGELEIDGGSTVNGAAITGSGNALLSSGARSPWTPSAAALNPSSFPVFSGSANANSTNLPGGTYASVAANTAGFTFLGGTYFISNLDVNASSITLGPGDYFISNLSLPDNVTITVSPAGPVRLFLRGLEERDGVSINAGGDPANLQIFLYGGGDIDFGDNSRVSAILYAPGGGSFEFDDSAQFEGAILTRTGEIDFGSNASITYSSTTQAAVAGVAPCAGPSPAAFVITAAASASTCVAHSITIRAVDTVGNTVTSYGGTVSLTTSTGRGGWANVSGSGALTETGTANDGEATYVFTSADAGQIVLSLSNERAEDLAITARDTTTGTITGTSGLLGFRDNAFVITPTDALANTVVAGRPHAMQIALWRRDTSLATPNCAIATSYTGARNLKAWYTPDINHPTGATAPSITGTLGTTVPATNNLSLTFAAGVATFNLGTSDVGKYVVNARDDSRTFAGAVNIDGSSPTLTVRPFAIAVTNAVRGGVANPEGAATAGGKFAAAGETFAATVAAYLWSAADDVDNDGTPDASANVIDNSLAPRFAWPVALSASSTAGLFTPVGGTLGVLGGTTTVAGGGFVSGAAVPTDLTYSEVGSIGLLATATGYLGTSGVDLVGAYRNASSGVAARIGRFHPASFALSGAGVTPSCSSGNQTYMNEPALGVAFTLQARNAAGAITTNYRASVYNVGAVNLHAENADAGINLSTRLTGLPATVWTLGAYSLTATGATFTRGGSPDGPFDSLVIGVSVTDPDGAVVSAPDMNAATAGACGTACNARALNGSTPTRVRFGRLKIGNALGAPQLDLPVPLTAQYWNGIAFVTNAQDNCTRLTNTQFAFGSYRAPLAACATSGAPAGANGIVFTSGRGALRLSKPGMRGSVDLTANLGSTPGGATCSAGAAATATAASRPWLQGNWGASTWDRDPAGRAVFGVPGASADVIYQRENY